MNIGVMTVKGFDFHPNGRFREEAVRMGHQITLINPYAMGCVLGKGDPGAFFSQSSALPDPVMPRQGSPMGEYGFVLLGQWERMGIPLVNGSRGVAVARNQFLTLQALAREGLPVPPSCFVLDRENFFNAVGRLGSYPVVAKQVNGMGGDGVHLIRDQKAAVQFLDNGFNRRKGLLVQSFIPARGRRDLRLLVIKDEVAGAMALRPEKGAFKANVHQAGTAVGITPDPKLCSMATAAAQACSLTVAGVDVMIGKEGGPVIVEVNYSPGFRGLEGATGLNIAGRILEHAVNTAKNRKQN